MKKTISMLLVLSMAGMLSGCAGKSTETTAADTTAAESAAAAEETTEAAESTAAETTEADGADGDVLNYEEYMAADLDTEVTIQAYVQAKQAWWEDQATVYAQDQDGAYFIYNAACSQEDYDLLVPGTKIQVTGYKSEWFGEVEIMD